MSTVYREPEHLHPFPVGQRVAANPGTGAFMQDDRFGVVQYADRSTVLVLMDRTGRVRRFHPERITRVRRPGERGQ